MRNKRSGSVPFAMLWPLLLLFLALHLVYNWAIPLGEGPDEPGHLAYSLFLADAGRLPVQRREPLPSDVAGEGHQPPLAYALAVPAVAWLPLEQRQILLSANPRFVWAGGDEPGAFLRGSQERWPWPPFTLAWHLVRAVSGLWGALAVLFTWLAARRLRPASPAFAALAAALVAFNPQFLFTTALASNDGLLAALGAALLWWCLVPGASVAGTGTSSSQTVWAVGAGALFGLALLTKQSALLLGPLLLWGGWRASGGSWPRFVAATLSWGAVALLVAGWWFVRNRLLYGDPFGLELFQSEFVTQPVAWGDPAAWAGALSQLFASFWARFGWLSLRPPEWIVLLYALLCAAALLGWTRAGLRRRGAEDAETVTGGMWLGPLIALGMACAWILAFAATAGLVAWQGRMLFPAIGAVGLLLAGGLLPSRPHSPHALTARTPSRSLTLPPSRPLAFSPSAPFQTLALCVLFVLSALLLPFAVIRPAYTWVALAPSVAQAQLGTPTYARFAASWERGVVLRGWRLDGPVQPGAPLPITFTWNSLEPVPRPWTVFVHLVDAEEVIVAQSNSQPLGSTLPFTRWTPGDWMADPHALLLPPDTPPGEYELRVGLFRPERDGQRQQVWAEDGSVIGTIVSLGKLRVP